MPCAFAERLQGFAPEDVNVVGTYTLRRAVNNDEFYVRLLPFFLIRLISSAVKRKPKPFMLAFATPQPESGRKLVIDIGGGSTEMIIGDDFPYSSGKSSHGLCELCQKFFPNGEISKENFEQARQSAVNKIEDLSWNIANSGGNQC